MKLTAPTPASHVNSDLVVTSSRAPASPYPPPQGIQPGGSDSPLMALIETYLIVSLTHINFYESFFSCSYYFVYADKLITTVSSRQFAEPTSSLHLRRLHCTVSSLGRWFRGFGRSCAVYADSNGRLCLTASGSRASPHCDWFAGSDFVTPMS